MSYNVRYFGHALKGIASTRNAKRRIAEAMSEVPADLIALQEVEARSVRSAIAHRGGRGLQLAAFVEALDEAYRVRGSPSPYSAYYFPAHVYRLGIVKFYTTGLAILVNQNALSVIDRSAPHAITHLASPRLKRVKQARIAAHLELETATGRRFHFFNTHLSLPSPWSRSFWKDDFKLGFGLNQLEEAKSLLRFVGEVAAGAPHLIAGDFNSRPASSVYRYVVAQGRLRSIQEELGQVRSDAPEAFATAGFLRMRMHLDHIFASPEFGALGLEGTLPFGDVRSRFHGLSDHSPIVARIEL